MKVVLTIAGSDSSGGAGIQADLKTFEVFDLFGTSVITVLTAQNTKGVTDISSVSPEFVKAQLEAVFDDFEIAAVKIGMLFSNEIIDTVREFIKDLDVPIVFDPVCISKAGSKLLNDDAVENLKTLLPFATVATPNVFEAQKLFNYQYHESNLEKSITSPCAVVVKNSQAKPGASVDILFKDNETFLFETPYQESNNTHGTGCSFSSAIAANLALGKSLEKSIEIAKKFIFQAIKHAPNLGGGKGPIAHKEGGEICHHKLN